jgi:hypothetical protein
MPRTRRRTGVAGVLPDERFGGWRLSVAGPAGAAPALRRCHRARAGVPVYRCEPLSVSEQVAQQVDFAVRPGLLPEGLDHHGSGIGVPG